MPAYQQDHYNQPTRRPTHRSIHPRRLIIKSLLPNETGQRARRYGINSATPKNSVKILGYKPVTTTFLKSYEIPYLGSGWWPSSLTSTASSTNSPENNSGIWWHHHGPAAAFNQSSRGSSEPRQHTRYTMWSCVNTRRPTSWPKSSRTADSYSGERGTKQTRPGLASRHISKRPPRISIFSNQLAAEDSPTQHNRRPI